MAAAVPVRPIVVLKMPTKVKSLIAFAQNVATAMTNNPTFPNPTPPIATLVADVAALNAAESAVLSRAKGAVQIRNQKLVVVRTDLENLKTYVQTVAGSGTPEAAQVTIQSAGLTTRKVTLHDKAALLAKQGSVSGTVTLVAKAVARTAVYEWQYSTDQKTWTSLPMTFKAKTGVSGLTPLTMYYFRMQPFTRTGLSNWGQIVSLLVN
jgi:hypothetical protein